MGENVAGAQLDADIDERVFGHKVACSHGIHCSDIPPYSTDLDAAWLVAEELRRTGFEIIISTEDDGWQVELCVTKELSERGYRGVYSKVGDVPYVLCDAALYAIEKAGPASEGE